MNTGKGLKTVADPRAWRSVSSSFRYYMLLSLLILTSAPSIANAAKYALVIGISEYSYRGSVQNLKFADKDAKAMRAALERAEYQVDELINDEATRLDILEKLRVYNSIKPTDEFILYFSGHGVRDSAANNAAFWLTYDANPNMLDNRGIRLSHLMDYVADIPAMNKLVLLDHCYSGDVRFERVEVETIDTANESGDGDTTNPPSGAPEGSKDVTTLAGKVFAKAALPDTISAALAPDEGRGFAIIAGARNLAFEVDELGHGVFTKALLTAFGSRDADISGAPDGGPDKVLSLSELLLYLDGAVNRVSLAVGAPPQKLKYKLDVDDPNGWILSDKLPIAEAAQVDAYKTQLEEWAGDGKMDTTTRRRAVSALNVIADPTILLDQDPDVARKWIKLGREIRDVMDDDTLIERMRIDEIERLASRIGSG